MTPSIMMTPSTMTTMLTVIAPVFVMTS